MINIAFVDWWTGFDSHSNFITRALDGKVQYRIVNNPSETDFVFCSVWKNDCFDYSCPRVLFTGECYTPDFNLYDYAIGFDKLLLGDRYIRYPLYLACYEEMCNKAQNERIISGNEYSRDFCSYVVSNVADDYRDRLYSELTAYKKVFSGGKHLNNIGIPDGVNDKQEFISQYKFNIACENVSKTGYCTEKIVEAFAANTIPIYWGDPDIEEYFNKKAFINCHNYENMNELIDHIKMIDSNNDLYMDMLSQSAFNGGQYDPILMKSEFENWIVSIVTQSKEKAFRRIRKGFCEIYEKELVEYIDYKNHRKKSLRRKNKWLRNFISM